MKRWEKKHCSRNYSHPVVSWGKTNSGVSRFHCRICKATFTWQQRDKRFVNRFSWFEAWLRGSSVSAIAKTSKRNRNTVLKTIYWHLDHPPKPKPIPPNPNCHLIIDGTWFKRENCLVVYWDTGLKRIQWWRYTTGEIAFEILADLKSIKEAGFVLASITSDGGRGIKGAVRVEHPEILHQRCTIHLQRHTLAWITRNPRTEAGRQIKPLIQRLSKIKTTRNKDRWLKEIQDWCLSWESFLKERTYADDGKHWWYTHKSLRRVRATIINAIPGLFYYLEDKTIPKDSNGLEGRFSSFKQHYRQHRGLSKKRRKGYIVWYLTVVVNREIPTRWWY